MKITVYINYFDAGGKICEARGATAEFCGEYEFPGAEVSAMGGVVGRSIEIGHVSRQMMEGITSDFHGDGAEVGK